MSFWLKFISLAVASGVSFAATVPPQQQGSEKEVRVLIAQDTHFLISGLDLILNGTIQYAGNAFFSVKCGKDKDGRAYVQFGPGQRSLYRLEIFAQSGFLQVNKQLYRNKATVIAVGNQCQVVNILTLEKYLAGLINKEMLPSWPLEALKAQAVAARSYAIAQMAKNISRDYDLESNVLDQVYDGASFETAKSSRAAAETAGVVLTFHQHPLKAYFHANCGGKTEVPESVWGQENEAFQSVICPYHQEKKNQSHWSLSLGRLQIETALKKVSGLLPKGFVRLAKLEVGAPNANQRLNDVVVADTTGASFIIPAAQFRAALGFGKVKSTAFQVHDSGAKIEIEGEGNGHGIGMCQIGAKAMAEEGRNFQDILRHYYPLAQIVRL